MRHPLLAAASLATVSARLLHSLPEDIYAFPKYRVAFLNGLPVLNETAEKWFKDGLRGGELEFMDQPWQDLEGSTPVHLKEIGSGDSHPAATPSPDSPAPLRAANYSLERMKMGPRDTYICLTPQPLDHVPPQQEDDSDADVTPARSWSLLQPLAGTCLYHRQGWFTYSYCHNNEIRQFKEMVPAQSRLQGTYQPEEDPEWESYTLGRAPRSAEPGADLSVAEQNAQAANLELARGAGSRYLVQRWADGTICDMTGKNREVEVQFHCSMENTDNILFVKETKTCSYVLVIQTPRLCGEPGFKSRRDAGSQAQIRCREIVNEKPERQVKLPATDHVLKVPMRKPVLPAAKTVPKSEKGAEDAEAKKEKTFNELLRKTLEAIVSGKKSGRVDADAEDGIVLEVVDTSLDELVEGDRLVDALRAAGYDVHTEVVSVDGGRVKKGDDKKDGDKHTKPVAKKKAAVDPHRDEL